MMQNLKKALFGGLAALVLAAGMNCGERLPSYDSRIPPEAAHKEAYCAYSKPPKGFRAVTFWGQAVQERGYDGESKIEVDYSRVWAKINGKDSLLVSDDHDERICGGCWTINPWFGTQTASCLPAEVENGIATFYPSDAPDEVWHWWNCKHPRAVVPEGATKVWFEARVRISKGCAQIGGDYYSSSTAPGSAEYIREAGASDWHFEDSPIDSLGWQTIEACY